jgi:hypothetical protein
MSTKIKKQKRERKTPGLKIMDAIIILLVLIAIVGVYFRYHSLSFFDKRLNMKEYTVSFSIDNIKNSTPKHLKVGDSVYFSDSGELLGTLLPESDSMENIALKCSPASEYFINDSGTMIEVNYPQDPNDPESSRVRAEGKLSCMGLYTENGAFLVDGSVYLAAGENIQIQTESVTLTIMIRDISLAQQS